MGRIHDWLSRRVVALGVAALVLVAAAIGVALLLGALALGAPSKQPVRPSVAPVRNPTTPPTVKGRTYH